MKRKKFVFRTLNGRIRQEATVLANFYVDLDNYDFVNCEFSCKVLTQHRQLTAMDSLKRDIKLIIIIIINYIYLVPMLPGWPPSADGMPTSSERAKPVRFPGVTSSILEYRGAKSVRPSLLRA